MKKIITWFSTYVAGCNSATQIRNAFSNLQSVKNSMVAINFAIIAALLGVILAPWLYAPTWEFASVFFGVMAFWFWRLRIAVATSQQARENFIRETQRVIQKLVAAMFAIAMTLVFLAWMAVVLATAIEAGLLESVVQVYPELKVLSQFVVEQVSAMIHKIVVYLAI